MASLEQYQSKRDFKKTSEPAGKVPLGKRGSAGGIFVIHKHAATRLHYDLRLEHGGVLWSWAVTRGPSLDPGEKRLAVRVEDHPLEYGGFEGTIPKGEYGGGTVMLWDRGTWEPLDDPHEGLKEGKLHFRLSGERLKGGWALIRMPPRRGKKKPASHPTAVLFNGGVFKAGPLRERVVSILNGWAKAVGAPAVKVLEGNDLELAVARGAAYYGLVRRGKGVRIRGGTARSYYVGIESSLPAVPGAPPPLKALCVVPFGMEEGTEADVPGGEIGLVVGEPAQFRFFSSAVRKQDQPGSLLASWTPDELDETDSMEATLPASARHPDGYVPVRFHSRVTELGMFELWCVAAAGDERWKLEFSVREEE